MFNIIIASFLNVCINGLFGRYLGLKGSIIFNITNNSLILINALLLFYNYNKYYWIIIINWIKPLNLNVSFYLDQLSLIMILLIVSISLVIHFFSIEYLINEPHFNRFFCYLGLFQIAMIILVSSGNLLQLFVGWELVGLASYLLINYWYTRIEANKSALLAMFLNKLGDLGLFISSLLLLEIMGSIDIPWLQQQNMQNALVFIALDITIKKWISFFLIVGLMSKSAQIGLHSWLVNAMEGPTPVSALLHSATMVTAGIFLLLRMNILFNGEQNKYFYNILVLIGSLTSFLGAINAIIQYDIKKIIAFSTTSQLGYLVLGLSLKQFNFSLFHLYSHGYFKACLFLGAGAIIHSVNNEQDFRRMGAFIYNLPLTSFIFFLASFSLLGWPFTAGFISKEWLMGGLFINLNSFYFKFGFMLSWITIGFTTGYSLLIFYNIFIKSTLINKKDYINSKETTNILNICLILISLMHFIVTFYLLPFLNTFNLDLTDFWYINSDLLNNMISNIETRGSTWKIIVLVFCLINPLQLYVLFLILFKNVGNRKFLMLILSLLDVSTKILNKNFNKYFLSFSYVILFKNLDKGIFNRLGPTYLHNLFLFIVNKIIHIQNGVLSSYIFLFTFMLFLFQCY